MGTVRSTSIEFGCPNYDGVRTSVPRPTVHIYIIDIFSRYTYSFSLLSINLCRLLQFDIIIDIYFSFQLFEKHHLSSITVARLVAS